MENLKVIKKYKSLEYLKTGSKIQVQALDTIIALDIQNILKEYNPTFVGTIPIRIDIGSSDIDILCETSDLSKIKALIRNSYGNNTGFTDWFNTINGVESYISKFQTPQFEIEIFSQNIPTDKQFGFIHMIVEHRILEIMGEKFRVAVKNLKLEGFKTEPAFAKLLNLQGDPYQVLADLYHLNNKDLRHKLGKC